MKNSIILLMGILWTLCSCSEVEVTDYSSDNFIQFEKAAKDSTISVSYTHLTLPTT